MIHFVNSLLLWGLPALAVPVLIHLLHRRRVRVLDWAAIEFLRNVVVRHRRRLLWEQIVLLALRCLLVAVLVLLFARPYLERPLFGLDRLGRARLRVSVLIDDSPSMMRSVEGQTLLALASQRALELCRALASRGERVSVRLQTCRRPEPLAEETLSSQGALDRLGAALDALRADDRPFDPVAGLSALAASGEGDAGTARAVFCLSDFQPADWTAGEGGVLREQVGTALRELAAGGPVVLVPLAPAESDNVSVAGLENGEGLVFSGRESVFQVRVRNWGGQARGAGVLRAAVDARELPPVGVPPIAPGAEVAVPLRVVFDARGDHVLSVCVDAPDTLPLDNLRRAVVSVEDRLGVLVMRGVLGDAPGGEAWFLRRAIDPDGNGSWGFKVDSEAGDRLPPAAPGGVCAVFVVDPQELGEAMTADLRGRLAEGGTVVLMLGPASDNPSVRRALAVLAPRVVVGPVSGTPEAAVHVRDLDWSHGLLRPFRRWETLFESVAIRRFFGLRIAPGGEDEPGVLARLDDADKSPYIIHITAGRGNLFLFAGCADGGWSDWPVSETGRITYVCLLQRLLEQYSGANWDRGNREAGAGWRVPFSVSHYSETALWRPAEGLPELGPAARAARTPGPAQPAEQPLRGRFMEDSGQWVFELQPPLTQRAGIYELVLSTRAGVHEVRRVGLGIAPGESDPARAAPAVFEGLGPNVRVAPPARAAGERPAAPRREYWPALALAALGLLLVEGLLAFRLSSPEAALFGRGKRGGGP